MRLELSTMNRPRHGIGLARWIPLFTLGLTLSGIDAVAQDAPASGDRVGPSGDPRAMASGAWPFDGVIRPKKKEEEPPRPRLFRRFFGGPTPPAAATATTTMGSTAAATTESPAAPGPGPATAGKPDPAVVPAQGVNQNQTSYLNVGDVSTGSQANLGFGARLFDAYFGPLDPPEPEDPANPSRRGYPAPFKAPPAPFSDFIGPTIGVNDTSVFPIMDALYKGRNGKAWKDSQFKIYGWFDPSYNASTSQRSNVPLAYNIVPNKLELSQVILILERVTNTAQTDHFDWGFKMTNLYGIDYRYTTAKGYFSDQLLKHNHLYGYDPLQLYIDLYFPGVAQGMLIRAGRYISPLDIEAQLSPDNYLYSHSLMYTYDPYTFTGIQAITKINDQFQMIVGVQGGNDMAPWTKASQPNGELLLKWVSKSNKDSLFGGIDSLGKGYYSRDHDDLQVFGFTWSHKFNDRFTTMTEQYYIWQRNALLGGTVTNGPVEPYFAGVGAGRRIPGLSDSYGIVNYTSYRTSDKGMLVLRSDCLADFQGERTGVPGAYFEHTLGFIYHLSPWAIVRPEARFDYTSGQKGYDNGTKRDQFTFSCDLIFRF